MKKAERAKLRKALLSSLALISVLIGASDGRTAFAPDIIVDDFTTPLTNENMSIFPDVGITSNESLEVGIDTLGGSRYTTLAALPGAIGGEFDETILRSGVTNSNSTGLLDQSISGAFGNVTQTMVLWNADGIGLNQDLSQYDRFEATLNLFALYGLPDLKNIGTMEIWVSNEAHDPYNNPDDINNPRLYSRNSITLDAFNLDSNSPPKILTFYVTDFSDPSVFGNPIQEIQLRITGNKPGLLFTLDSLIIKSPEPSLVLGCIVLFGTQAIVTGWRKRK